MIYPYPTQMTSKNVNDSSTMKIAYYLSRAGKNNLYCRISEGPERVSFPLGHTILPREWNPAQEQELPTEPYYFMLINLNNYLITKYRELKNMEPTGVLARLKTNIEAIVVTSGIENIPQTIKVPFQESIPDYDSFFNAFERHTGLIKGDYRSTVNADSVDFQTKNGVVYTLDTYEGLTHRLRTFTRDRSYENISQMTSYVIWREVFEDIRLNKHCLFPTLLEEWELYWKSQPLYSDKLKAESRRRLQVLMADDNAANDWIGRAYEIDKAVLFPLVVISLLNLYIPDSFFTNYCHIEFSGEEWEGIVTGTNPGSDTTLFFVKTAEL